MQAPLLLLYSISAKLNMKGTSEIKRKNNEKAQQTKTILKKYFKKD